MELHNSETNPSEQTALLSEQRRQLQFTGTAGEYFRIWIINTVLTVLTLGFYIPWAKVRTRRYFYANTLLDDQPFDYLAKPRTLLRGYLIVGTALIVIQAARQFVPAVGSVLSLVGVSLIPVLVYKAHRFRARNIGYRNLRFRFLGTIGGAYWAHAFYPLAALAGFLASLPFLLAGPEPRQQAAALVPALTAAAAVLMGLVLVAVFP